MDNEVWKYYNHTTTANARIIEEKQINAETKVEDMEPHERERMFPFFGSKPFLKLQAQGFEQYVILQAYKQEEE